MPSPPSFSRSSLPALPIDEVLAELVQALGSHDRAVLQADPGAGKTTRVPLALLDLPWASGEILVAEPRRLAARQAAERVSQLLGETVGNTVGYSVRFEDVRSARTRLRFVTEGLLVRQLLGPQPLQGVSCVVLDEFHERHLATDQCLMLFQLASQRLAPARAVPKLIVMSATLDAERVARFLQPCARVKSEGRQFPLQIVHQTQADDRPLERRVASAVRECFKRDAQGDVLVFLPGRAEIGRAERELCALQRTERFEVRPLHGDLDLEAQRQAILPGPLRKVVLSTNLAESSVTIENVRFVVDSGLVRVASHSPWTGRPSLSLQPISQASAVQRAGRAGRTRPGVVLRLYTRENLERRAAFERPEIQRADLSELVLHLSCLNAVAASFLSQWLDAPSEAAVGAATATLQSLGALDPAAQLTPLGASLLQFPVHPRLARLIVAGHRLGIGADACLAAALLAEGQLTTDDAPPRPTGWSDVQAMLDEYRALERGRFRAELARALGLRLSVARNVRHTANQLLRLLQRVGKLPEAEPERAAAPANAEGPRRLESETPCERRLRRALLCAFGDRLGKRRGDRELTLASGSSAELHPSSAVRQAPLLLCIELSERQQGMGKTVLVTVASAVEPSWVLEDCEPALTLEDTLVWNEGRERVECQSRIRYGSVVLEEQVVRASPSPAAASVLLRAAQARLASLLEGPASPEQLVGRLQLLSQQLPLLMEGRTPLSLEAVLELLCQSCTSLDELRSGNWEARLKQHLTAEQLAKLELWTPAFVQLPGGRSVPVHYETTAGPWIASRLQHFFGMDRPPSVCSAHVPLTLHLLAPNGRAVQVTQDLRGFWATHYPQLRRALCRRYPKHPWPEDGLAAKPPAMRPGR